MCSLSVSPGSIYTCMRTAFNASIASPAHRKREREVWHIELIPNGGTCEFLIKGDTV